MECTYINKMPVALSPVILCFALQAAWGGSLSVIPQPQTIQPREGSFRLAPQTTIAVDHRAAGLGKYLHDLLHPATGFPLPVVEITDAAPAGRGLICLWLASDAQDLGDEGYALSVGQDRIVLRAPTEAGIFYGIQTLRQLLSSAIESSNPVAQAAGWEIPCVEIVDRPRFVWRGLMLDCSRTFWSKDYVKHMIRLMALYKLNRLHLHLTDDQGWRLEIKKYPRLTQFGSKFAARFHEPARVQGYYTQDDIKELIAYARQHYVIIIPEIEIPGHSTALLACYPELSCTGGPFEIHPFSKGPGIHKDICCLGNDETLAFFEDVLTEVAALFPSEFIHIGGDEAPANRWKKCPKCQAKMRQEGFRNERELQSYFVKRIAAFLAPKGKRVIGWDNILEGGPPPGAAVMSWRGMRGGITGAKVGHDVVMSPRSLYFNYRRVSTMQAYDFDPVPKELRPEEARHVLGAQACFWTQTYRTEAGVDGQLFPRLLAIAEVTWAAKASHDSEDFRSRVLEQVDRLGRLGVKARLDASVKPKDSGQPKSKPGN